MSWNSDDSSSPRRQHRQYLTNLSIDVANNTQARKLHRYRGSIFQCSRCSRFAERSELGSTSGMRRSSVFGKLCRIHGLSICYVQVRSSSRRRTESTVGDTLIRSLQTSMWDFGRYRMRLCFPYSDSDSERRVLVNQHRTNTPSGGEIYTEFESTC